MNKQDIVREFYAGVIGGDTDRVNAAIDSHFSQDAIVRMPESLYYGGEYQGAATLKKLFAGLAHPKSAVRADTMQLERVGGSGDYVVTLLSCEWRGRSGGKLQTRITEWIEFDEKDRITEICAFYADTAQCVAVDQAPREN
jgi:hypothetical protein